MDLSQFGLPGIRRDARQNTGFGAFRIGGILLCAALVSVAWGQGDSGSGAATLQGLLPEGVPEGVSTTLASLPENWQSWAEGVSAELETLYSADADPAARDQSIAALGVRLGVIQQALNDPQYVRIYPELTGLREKLQRRLDLINAVRATLSVDPQAARTATFQAASQRVAQAAQALDAYLAPIPNGSSWSEYVRTAELAQAVSQGPEAALPALQQAQARLRVEGPNVDPTAAQFLSGSAFRQLAQAVDACLAAATSLTQPVPNDQIREQLGALLSAIEDYEATGSGTAAAAVRNAYNTLRRITPDAGAQLSAVLQKHYFNYNLRIAASEEFINRLAAQQRTEQSGVRDYVLGADVYGSQVSSTNATVDLLPSPDSARFAINVTGHINSSTQGVTSQATIFTQGNHSFLATKEVSFDGSKFTTYPASISVNANNITTGATTKYEGIPIIGRIANRRAIQEAENRSGYSEAHARGRIAERVIPELDMQVDSEFGRTNSSLVEREKALHELGLVPDVIVARTSDTQLNIWARLMGAGELGGTDFPAALADTGVIVQVHESLLNNSFDEMQLEGRTMTEDELRVLLEQRLSKLFNRPVQLQGGQAEAAEGEADANEPRAFIFADKDPIRVRVGDGQLSIVIRAGFQREGRDNIPPQQVTVPLRFESQGDQVVLTRGDVSVSPVERPANVAEQVALAGVVRRKIESAIPSRTIDRQVRIQGTQGKEIPTTLAEITAIDGWLTIVLK